MELVRQDMMAFRRSAATSASTVVGNVGRSPEAPVLTNYTRTSPRAIDAHMDPRAGGQGSTRTRPCGSLIVRRRERCAGSRRHSHGLVVPAVRKPAPLFLSPPAPCHHFRCGWYGKSHSTSIVSPLSPPAPPHLFSYVCDLLSPSDLPSPMMYRNLVVTGGDSGDAVVFEALSVTTSRGSGDRW